MNKKTLIMVLVIVLLLAAGAIAYKTYRHSQTQTAAQVMQQSPSVNNSTNSPASDNNAVNPSSSPQEQQAQQNLNSLDNGDHN